MLFSASTLLFSFSLSVHLQGLLSQDTAPRASPLFTAFGRGGGSSSRTSGSGLLFLVLLVPKSKGEVTSILDLCNLNKYIRYMRFCMVTLSTILSPLTQNDWFAALGFRTLISKRQFSRAIEDFLWFVVEDHHFQYTVLPFGLFSAPGF